MTQALGILAAILAIAISLLFLPEGPVGILICGLMSVAAIYFIRTTDLGDEEKDFLVKVFLGGLLVRVLLAAVIYGFGLEPYFGPDAYSYHKDALQESLCWAGKGECVEDLPVDGNWVMKYYVIIVYYLTGPSRLTMQLMSAVFGAATAVIIYLCAYSVFNNRRVAQYSAIFVAFLPAMVIWSSQLLKDGIIIFLLVLIMLSVIRLQQRFNYLNALFLVSGMLGILGLRFYIFYMVCVAAFGGFLLGTKTSLESLVRRVIIFACIGLAFTYAGILQTSEEQFSTHGTLENIQFKREAAKVGADSAIEDDTDVSTTTGAISAIPAGVATILLAPFPWQVQKFTQILTLPEMFVWWAMLPLMVIGLRYTFANRLRESISILFFSFMLLITYAVYQGNLGTMYRQRAQIQVFLLVFAAVGLVVRLEKSEHNKLLAMRRWKSNQTHTLAKKDV